MSFSVQVYSYSRCATCRKALAWLKEHQIDYQLIDIVQVPPSKKILEAAMNQLGNRKNLFNTSGISYRSIGSAVIKAMSDLEALEALAADGKLIKRPLLITSEGKFLVGFKPEVWWDCLLG